MLETTMECFCGNIEIQQTICYNEFKYTLDEVELREGKLFMNTEKIKKFLVPFVIGCIVPLVIIAYAFYSNDKFQVFTENIVPYFFLSCIIGSVVAILYKSHTTDFEMTNKQKLESEKIEELTHSRSYNQGLFYSKVQTDTYQSSKLNSTKTIVENELDRIDAMSVNGYEFEKYINKLLEKHGFKTEITQASNDSGVDVIATNKDGVRYAIQCKCYSSTVGNSAVQQVIAGMNIYGCQVAVVITNNYFTLAAKKLAEANKVLLWDRDVLKKMILEQ